MTHKNSTFVGGDPTWANACVGENGLPGYWDYAKGFSQAAKVVIDLVIANRGLKYSVDELIYPVCFNMRHSVELRLKGAIEELIQIEEKRERKLVFDLAGSHDIWNIWSYFSEKSLVADDRYEPMILRLNSKIADIADIDSTGQTFRYPLSKESKKHLVDVSIINFVVLKRRFYELEKVLDDLHRLNKYLRDEYQCETFTKNLSRKNLFEIASLLPNREMWRDESFGVVKEELKLKYGIGSKELSDSIKLIESNYELAPRINISKPLRGIDFHHIKAFLDHWFQLHELKDDKDSLDIEVYEQSSEDLFKSIIEKDAIREEIWDSVKTVLGPEQLAGLSALFYFGQELEFSENYELAFSQEFLEVESLFSRSERLVKTKYFHLLNKTCAPHNFLKALFFLRKDEIAEKTITLYNLDEKFSWLDDARTRVLFQKPDYCGYAL